jgi:(2Fe-2S) ferredoxin
MNRIYIGMGTCGLASGAEQVKDAVARWVDEKKANVRITATGCIGYCQAEPIIDTVSDSGHGVSFGEARPESVRTLHDRVLASRDHGIAGVLGQYWNGSGPPSGGALKSVPFIDEHPFFKKQLKLILKNCGVIEPTSIGDYRASGGSSGPSP